MEWEGAYWGDKGHRATRFWSAYSFYIVWGVIEPKTRCSKFPQSPKRPLLNEKVQIKPSDNLCMTAQLWTRNKNQNMNMVQSTTVYLGWWHENIGANYSGNQCSMWLFSPSALIREECRQRWWVDLCLLMWGGPVIAISTGDWMSQSRKLHCLNRTIYCITILMLVLFSSDI